MNADYFARALVVLTCLATGGVLLWGMVTNWRRGQQDGDA